MDHWLETLKLVTFLKQLYLLEHITIMMPVCLLSPPDGLGTVKHDLSLLTCKLFSSLCFQGRQFPVQVMYTSEPQDSYTDAALNATLQVGLSCLVFSLLRYMPHCTSFKDRGTIGVDDEGQHHEVGARHRATAAGMTDRRMAS